MRVSRLFIKTFCSTALKTFVREPFSLLLISGFETNMPKRIMSRFSVNFFSLAVPKNFVGETICVSQKFWCQNFAVEIFLSRSTERLCWGTLLFFRNFLVSESIMNKMGGGKEVVSRLFIKSFCSTPPKNFVRSPIVCC